jgi:hypothetical protein
VTTLKVEIDCTRVTCARCHLRPDAEPITGCPLFPGPDAAIWRCSDDDRDYYRCKACRHAELEASPIVMQSWMPSYACAIVCIASLVVAIKYDIWWFFLAAFIYLVWTIQFMPQRKRSSKP